MHFSSTQPTDTDDERGNHRSKHRHIDHSRPLPAQLFEQPCNEHCKIYVSMSSDPSPATLTASTETEKVLSIETIHRPRWSVSSQLQFTHCAQSRCFRSHSFKVFQWINELSNPDTRETALMELSKKRETVQDLAPMLWHSFGTIVALLQEIINIYPSINPPTLTAHQSNRVCNALALLQCVASHPETRSVFLNAQIPLFLYPFLNTTAKTRPFEYLRLTSLGVIGALVKVSARCPFPSISPDFADFPFD